MSGTYCFWWNYTGYLEGGDLFRGPDSPDGGRYQSKLIVSCYFGYGHWRSPSAYGSCEKFKRSKVVAETHVSAAYFAGGAGDVNSVPEAKLYGGFTDGHVESFSTADAVPMRVSKTSDGRTPYPGDIGPGVFYLPRSGLR